MPYVTRTIEPAVAEFIRRPEPHKNVLLVEGARQVGKTSLIDHCIAACDKKPAVA
jgi:predicted AAA+ superfamily ATPase